MARSFLILVHGTVLPLSGCATTVVPEDVLPSHAVPTAPASDIVTGRSEGRLEYRNGCLFLNRAHAGRRVRSVIIWPLNTRFNGSVVVPGQSASRIALRVGEEVVIQGNAPDWAPYLFVTYPTLSAWHARCGERPLFVGSIRRAR